MSSLNIDGNSYWILPDGTVYSTFGDTANCTLRTCPVQTTVYGYRPTLPGSASLIALYELCALIQSFLGIRYRSWFYMAAMDLGCITEILGYASRILYYYDPWSNTGFIMQIVCITTGPVFFSAAIYVMLSRLVEEIDVHASRINSTWLYWPFICSDVVSLVLQAAGGALSASSAGTSTTGIGITLAGLSFQVATLFVFGLLVGDYIPRSRHTWRKIDFSARFKTSCAFLALATILIFIRCCYRIYELSEGYASTSKALRDEKLFIGFESTTIILAAYCLIIAHPGFMFVGVRARKRSMRDQDTAEENARKTEMN